jgi:hypothetical protein
MNKIIGTILLNHFLNKSKNVLISWFNGNRNFNKEENMNLKQEKYIAFTNKGSKRYIITEYKIFKKF